MTRQRSEKKDKKILIGNERMDEKMNNEGRKVG